MTVAVPTLAAEELLPLFRLRVQILLRMLDIPDKTIEEEIQQYEQVQFAKTASRSVLGSMNDIAYNYQVQSEMYDITSSSINLSYTEFQLSNMPAGPLKYRSPSDVAKELLEG